MFRLAFIRFYDMDGRLLAAAGQAVGDIETVRREIVFEETPLGTAEIGLDLKSIDRRIKELDTQIQKQINDAKAIQIEETRRLPLEPENGKDNGVDNQAGV